MRILVVGGTGFIGSYVTARLAEMGHEVTVYHRGKTEPVLPAEIRHVRSPAATIPIRHFPAELTNPAPDVVLHMVLIGQADAAACMRAFRGVARRVVAISSGDVYRAYGRLLALEPGPAESQPLGETAPLRERLYPYRTGNEAGPEGDPGWVHDYEKILVEREVLGEPELPGMVLRLPMVYGPGDGQRRLYYYLKRMDDGRPAIVLDEGLAGWRWTRAYVENVAVAIALAVTAERARGRIYNVGAPEAETEAEWVRRIGAVAGWHGTVIALPREALPAHLVASINTEHHLLLDDSRLRSELGYVEAVERDEGLRRTIAWQRTHPPARIDPKAFDYAAEDAILARHMGSSGEEAVDAE